MTEPQASTPQHLQAARSGDEAAFRGLVQPYQRELRAYCYRMSGSLHEADDLVQESLLRAWRGLSGFEGRASIRTWLYRVAFSACVDHLDKLGPRSLPWDAGAPADPTAPMPAPQDEGWLEPCPSSLYADEPSNPEARVGTRESVTLAFLAALQLLPPRQRAMLLARDVLGWSAEECAETFELSVAAVNSALQRARDTLEQRASRWRAKTPDDEATRSLLSRYVAAWEQADVTAFTSLLHEDAALTMPPLPLWLLGPRAIAGAVGAMVLTPEARGALRMVPTEANGCPAFAMYRRAEAGGWVLASLHVLTVSDGRVKSICGFLDPRSFAGLALPASI